MLKIASSLFLFTLFIISIQADESILSLPHKLNSLKIQNTDENLRSTCSYTVSIRTSCSSVRYTRDKISLAFGDSYGYQVYVRRLDDPSSGAFESCSTDTYQISGPCMSRICYLYLVSVGSDGWKPESITVYGHYTQAVTFYYNTFLPNGVWYGFNYCNTGSSISKPWGGLCAIACTSVLCYICNMGLNL
ncbi:Embryo-specific protein ats3 [Thalictrum thalictroides]|uniref:Embryo-specific protein ats3 n=1 Tax=Thalictrum thalictroides TaxID=46969 RepID=A0A7J6UZ34_THATH|nr:Embryo-specific protein ats3 [Thalictrum thalictroides]